LRDADASISRAIGLLSRTDVLAETGLSPELFLTLEAGWTATDARMVVKAERTLRAMPLTRAAFAAGKLSWGEVRAIVSAVRSVDVHGRAAIDQAVDDAAGLDEPDAIIGRVDDLVASQRADLALAREDRAIERSFLAVQPHLDGKASFYGQAGHRDGDDDPRGPGLCRGCPGRYRHGRCTIPSPATNGCPPSDLRDVVELWADRPSAPAPDRDDRRGRFRGTRAHAERAPPVLDRGTPAAGHTRRDRDDAVRREHPTGGVRRRATDRRG
jgi:hypothetical protein